jgi:hypothetical protein
VRFFYFKKKYPKLSHETIPASLIHFESLTVTRPSGRGSVNY